MGKALLKIFVAVCISLVCYFSTVEVVVWADEKTPADRVPKPQRKRCIPFIADLSDDKEAVAPNGLRYDQVARSLNKVIQYALYCEQPKGFAKLDLTFELNIGCNGLISEIEVTDDGGAPEEYVTCVTEVIEKASFPAHDISDGMPVTYPVNVAW